MYYATIYSKKGLIRAFLMEVVLSNTKWSLLVARIEEEIRGFAIEM